MGHNDNEGTNANAQVGIQPNRGRMGVLSDKNIALSAVLHNMRGIIEWPLEFFTLSEEDRLKAGIDVGSEVHDSETGPAHSFPSRTGSTLHTSRNEHSSNSLITR
jgi:hypothetical protein